MRVNQVGGADVDVRGPEVRSIPWEHKASGAVLIAFAAVGFITTAIYYNRLKQAQRIGYLGASGALAVAGVALLFLPCCYSTVQKGSQVEMAQPSLLPEDKNGPDRSPQLAPKHFVDVRMPRPIPRVERARAHLQWLLRKQEASPSSDS